MDLFGSDLETQDNLEAEGSGSPVVTEIDLLVSPSTRIVFVYMVYSQRST